MSYKDLDNWQSMAPERIAKYDVQLAQRGFDDTDWWSLYTTIAQFTLPRLIAFREGCKSYPASITAEEWDEILDKMIHAFTIIASEDDWPAPTPENAAFVQEGCELFGKWFTHLWS